MSPIETAFWQFHREHPEVYRHLVMLARQLKETGQNRIGIATLYETLRWFYRVGNLSGDPYKLNNNYRSYYTRLIMDRCPDLVGMFELRALHWDDEGVA